jgi:hypothetical protein
MLVFNCPEGGIGPVASPEPRTEEEEEDPPCGEENNAKGGLTCEIPATASEYVCSILCDA